MATPLHKASENGHIDAMRLLINHGANINKKDNDKWTPLHEASWNGNIDAMQLLIDAGADVNEKDNTGWTPLLRGII
jgi:ankyrin repeat protein